MADSPGRSSPPTADRIGRHLGIPVKKGDLLLEINPAPYQSTVNQVEAQLAAANEDTWDSPGT
jgi:hypothetical protein